LLGPNYRNFHFASSKMTSINERLRVQFRADFYNPTNHPNFANPYSPDGRSLEIYPITAASDVGLGNPILGGGGPRSIQFGLKLLL
jgi:hypothetical protein